MQFVKYNKQKADDEATVMRQSHEIQFGGAGAARAARTATTKTLTKH